jgi:hypothetical protein
MILFGAAQGDGSVVRLDPRWIGARKEKRS